ncbi:hypothetical protein AMATHDRAFT_192475 [Amanita thiersii Skay4041]|uniref:FAD/NAD(P)-binding domain-containing protein n=1 Tax=Amanita thiersii Skay4041 TaxID=703135 RepID=A0A2A9NT26_9AGAR|nr:hypothetical protein AMATHDRAFT_192475 [Amanita thiersii Skay4041]
MVTVRQIILSLISSQLPPPEIPSNVALNLPNGDSKSIAIVGAGVAGLSMLKTLLDLPEQQRTTWDIVVFEERANIGGIWLPEPSPKPPPEIPETPLYPLLHTNTPIPMMTYPGLPFPKGTHLFPSHEHVLAYITHYSDRFNLAPHIQFNQHVLSASWHGSSTQGNWNVTYSNQHNATQSRLFDHLIVASGSLHIPRIPHWRGEREWLAKNLSPQRELMHSIWYRDPSKYRGKSVLIVGDSASGRDIASQLAPIVRKLYISIRGNTNKDDSHGPLPPNAIRMPGISHFTADLVVFVNDSAIEVDTVLLATGYEMRKPFLDAGGVLTTDPTARSNASYSKALVSNTRYIFPLYKHIFSLSPSYPPNALAFIGLLSGIPNCPADLAQSLIVAHAIRDPSVLPSRKRMLQELATQEQELRNENFDPYTIGHLMVDGKRASDYQDDLVDYLKDKGVIADDGHKFVDKWRREIFTYRYLKRGWKRIEALGVGDEWTRDVEREEEWAELMEKVNSWQEEYEGRQDIEDSVLVQYNI